MKDLGIRIINSVFIVSTLILASAIFLMYKKYHLSEEFIAYSILIIILAFAASIDLKEKIIPNKLIIIGFCASIVAMYINREITILSRLLGAAVSGGVLVGLSYLTKGGIGLGDAKLIAVIGLFVGIVNVFNVLMISTMFSGILSIILLAIKIRDKKDSLPFAPFIFIGTIIILLIN